VLKYAADNGLISKPVLYGQGFKRPSQKVLRKARNAKGLRMFEADQLRRILATASQPLKAMILLGINCGYGNNDCGQLPLAALDLEEGWVNFPRPKTGVNRRCPLWPETIDALKEAIAKRPAPKKEADAGLVFITKYRQSWSKKGWTQRHEDENDPKEERAVVDNPISKQMTKFLKELKLHRPGLGFYALRHTLETIGGETDRQTAVDYIMGHAPRGDDMSAVYRERIGDERLKAVTDHVRVWLFKNEPAQGDILPMRKHKHQSRGRKTKNASG